MDLRDDETLKSIRLDKWLWAARFFKTRALATEAVSGGKVHYNKGRVKPAHRMQIGALITIQIGEVEKIVTVLALSEIRRPAKEAVLLYEETAESMAANEKRRNAPRDDSIQAPKRRPDKKARRLLQKIKRGPWVDF